MSFRKSPHLGSTEYSPIELMFGHEMRLPFDATLQPRDNLQRDAKQYMKDLLARLKVSTEIAKANDLYNQSKNKEYHDKSARRPDFAIGDLVLMKNHKVPTGLSHKLYDKSDDPYRIVGRGQNYTYKMRRLSDNKLHVSMINASNLKHYYPPEDIRQRLDVPDAMAVPPEDDNDQPQPPNLELPANADQPGNNEENNQQHHPPAALQETTDEEDENQTPPLPPPQPTKKWNFEKVSRGKINKKMVCDTFESNGWMEPLPGNQIHVSTMIFSKTLIED